MTSRAAGDPLRARAVRRRAARKADLEQAAAASFGVRRARRRHTSPRAGARNPAIPAARKRAVVEALLLAGRSHPPMVAKLLLLLAERDRLVLLPELAAAFRARLMDHQKVVRAEVTTAIALPADRVAALQQRPGAGDRPRRCSSRRASIRRSSAAWSRASAARSTTAASRRSCEKMKQR